MYLLSRTLSGKALEKFSQWKSPSSIVEVLLGTGGELQEFLWDGKVRERVRSRNEVHDAGLGLTLFIGGLAWVVSLPVGSQRGGLDRTALTTDHGSAFAPFGVHAVVVSLVRHC